MPAVMNSNVKRDADVHTQTWVAIVSVCKKTMHFLF